MLQRGGRFEHRPYVTNKKTPPRIVRGRRIGRRNEAYRVVDGRATVSHVKRPPTDPSTMRPSVIQSFLLPFTFVSPRLDQLPRRIRRRVRFSSVRTHSRFAVASRSASIALPTIITTTASYPYIAFRSFLSAFRISWYQYAGWRGAAHPHKGQRGTVLKGSIERFGGRGSKDGVGKGRYRRCVRCCNASGLSGKGTGRPSR